jgi:hypothetical protein
MQIAGSLKIIGSTFQAIKKNFFAILLFLAILCAANFLIHYQKPAQSIDFLQIFEQNYSNYSLKFYEKLYLKSYNPSFRSSFFHFLEVIFKVIIFFSLILIIDKRTTFLNSIIVSTLKIPTFLIASILVIPLTCFPILIAYLFFLLTSSILYQIFVLLIAILFVFYYIARFCLYFYCIASQNYDPIEALKNAFSYSKGNANAIMSRSFVMFLFTSLIKLTCWIFFRDIKLAMIACTNFNLIFLTISHYFIFKTLKNKYEAMISS